MKFFSVAEETDKCAVIVYTRFSNRGAVEYLEGNVTQVFSVSF